MYFHSLPIHLPEQMQWTFVTPILVLALVFVQFTWMRWSVQAVRLTSLTVLEALLSAVLLSTHIQEYDVKVCENSKIMCSGMIMFAGLQVSNRGSL